MQVYFYSMSKCNYCIAMTSDVVFSMTFICRGWDSPIINVFKYLINIVVSPLIAVYKWWAYEVSRSLIINIKGWLMRYIKPTLPCTSKAIIPFWFHEKYSRMMAKSEKPIRTISNRIVTVRMGEDSTNPSESKQKPKKPAWYVHSFNEFCNATALHGYSYIVKKNTALWERWVIRSN